MYLDSNFLTSSSSTWWRQCCLLYESAVVSLTCGSRACLPRTQHLTPTEDGADSRPQASLFPGSASTERMSWTSSLSPDNVTSQASTLQAGKGGLLGAAASSQDVLVICRRACCGITGFFFVCLLVVACHSWRDLNSRKCG